MSHFSWNPNNKIDIDTFLDKRSNNSKFASRYFNNIPIFEIANIDIFNNEVKEDIYNSFYNESGAIIIKGVYTKELMNEYNNWCEKMLKISENDLNSRHPKQKGKFLINDIIGRMSLNNPDLFMKILNNNNLLILLDNLLGCFRFGSCTTHWINPGVDRQLSHVDYPIHIGSGKFWDNSVDKMKSITTKYQLNHILPYYSVQAYIASDYTSKHNGSTEVIPGSHKIDNLDVLLHQKEYYDKFEKHFVNVELDQGDILIFNRRLCHRGGKNISDFRRNSLIMQCVWFWGLGQEEIDYDNLINNLNKSELFMKLSKDEKEQFLIRFKQPYPINVKNNA